MAVTIEDILLAKAASDSQNQGDPAVAMGLGAAGGAVLGTALGSGIHGMSYVPKTMGQRIRPGARMAGGLVGAILGGALGDGMRKEMATGSPAGEMLAKLQVQGGQLSSSDQIKLQQILADIYGGK